MTPQPSPITQQIRAFFDGIKNTAANLADRWRDEEEYEDIGDYKKVLQEVSTPFKVQVLTMTRRPFGFTFIMEGNPTRYRFTVLARKFKCEPIRPR